MFGEAILKPDLNRTPSYDSLKPEKGKIYEFKCICGELNKIDVPSYIGDYQDRERVLGEENSEEIRKHFGLRSDRSLINGWPKFRIEKCLNCEAKYLVYIAVFEPANGWFQVVPQGITQILPSNTKIKSDE
jgi:hypothetical protein